MSFESSEKPLSPKEREYLRRSAARELIHRQRDNIPNMGSWLDRMRGKKGKEGEAEGK